MRKVLLTLTSGLFCFTLLAQKNLNKSQIAPSPFFKIFDVTYERALTERLTTLTSVRLRPASGFKDGFAQNFEYEGQTYNPFPAMKLSAVGNTTEIRIYKKDNGALKGFYWGPFFKATQYKITSGTVPASFHDENDVEYFADVEQNLKLSFVGGGLQIGTQFLIKDLVAIDWNILGIGVCNARLGGGLEATNTSNNFNFKNYEEDVNKTTFGLENLLPIEKTVYTEAVSYSVGAPFIMLKLGLSVGIAY